ncbi:hypothetical protein [Parabacteroides bouchesdurhonensis]|uniref:HU family DNA-binding protein n=1 Tax=Parabacteroides bouchesdurhonensis TaxID=1936995 RepID=UPI00131DAA70|nr:hypothetical protein [Parabacteroides bouchesdurhonensis]
MSAEYRMERNPGKADNSGKQALHPRLIPHRTVGTKEIAKFSQETSSISSADMLGALEVLSQYTAMQLREGYTVYIEGIGYLSATLQSRPVMEADELRSESVRFKNVAFRCDKELKKKLRTMPVFKAQTTKKEVYDMEERKSRLIWYLDRYEYITSTYYAALNNCSKYSAQKDLNQLTENGLLVKNGHRCTTTYRKNDTSPDLISEMRIPE